MIFSYHVEFYVIIWLNPQEKMKWNLYSDLLPERARWAHLDHSGLPLWSRRKKFFFWPEHKSFMDQACSVNMSGYWPHSFLRFYFNLHFVSVNKNAKNKIGQYPAILTSPLVNFSMQILCTVFQIFPIVLITWISWTIRTFLSKWPLRLIR